MSRLDFSVYANTSAGLSSAINQLMSDRGGELSMRSGPTATPLTATKTFNDSTNKPSLSFLGDGSTVVQFQGSNTQILFNAADLAVLRFRGINFIGDPVAAYDCLNGFVFSLVDKVVFENCRFLGIAAKDSLFKIGPADVSFNNCTMGGCRADTAVIYGDSGFAGLHMDNFSVLDYGQLNGVTHSKVGNPYWILIQRAASVVNDFLAPRVDLRDVRFDENAVVGARFENVPQVTIDGGGYNVPSWTNAAAFEFSGSHGTIRNFHFGYAGVGTPAVRALDSSQVLIQNCNRSQSVAAPVYDSTSRITIERCVNFRPTAI